MYLGIPQLIYIALSLLSLGAHLANHGQPKISKYNFWASLMREGIIIWILCAGGFFSK